MSHLARWPALQPHFAVANVTSLSTLMSLRRLAQHCAPLLQLLTHTQSAVAVPGAAFARLQSTKAPAEQQLFGGQTLQEIRHRIFGDHNGNNLSSGRKVLRKKLVGDKIASYYGSDKRLEREDPFFVDLTAEGCAIVLLFESLLHIAMVLPAMHVCCKKWPFASRHMGCRPTDTNTSQARFSTAGRR